ncbi:hypothetical protein ACFSUK_26490 [Sphingobium scionense]
MAASDIHGRHWSRRSALGLIACVPLGIASIAQAAECVDPASLSVPRRRACASRWAFAPRMM